MKDGFGVFELMATLAIMAIMIIGSVIPYFECHAKWDRAGMSDVEWGIIQGCMVKLPDGRWLPAERLREMDLSGKK